MADDPLLINDLAKKAGVSVRTIRYYVKEGLLPAPQFRGRYSFYDEAYLYRLKLIQQLKQAFLPLKEIRRQLENLTPEQIKALVDEREKTASNDPVVKVSMSPSIPIPVVARESSSAVEYVSRILTDRPAASPIHSPAPSAAPERVFSSPELKTHSTMMPGIESVSAWRRIQLKPGIELQVQEPVKPDDVQHIRRIIEFAKNLFQSDERNK
jgi:DNA-binding transcriptional MerR regulator